MDPLLKWPSGPGGEPLYSSEIPAEPQDAASSPLVYTSSFPMPQDPCHSLVVLADVGAEPFHVGDEAMLTANVETLRRYDPDVRVTVVGREARGEDRPKAIAEALEGAQ